MILFSDFRSSLISYLLLYFSQRNDTREIPQHSRETEEVAAACGQDVPGAGTTLRSQCSSDDAHLTASWREAGGCSSRADPLPCSWYSALWGHSAAREESVLPKDQCSSVSFQALTISTSDAGNARGHIVLKGQSPALLFLEVIQEPQDLTVDLIQWWQSPLWQQLHELYLIS